MQLSCTREIIGRQLSRNQFETIALDIEKEKRRCSTKRTFQTDIDAGNWYCHVIACSDVLRYVRHCACYYRLVYYFLFFFYFPPQFPRFDDDRESMNRMARTLLSYAFHSAATDGWNLIQMLSSQESRKLIIIDATINGITCSFVVLNFP